MEHGEHHLLAIQRPVVVERACQEVREYLEIIALEGGFIDVSHTRSVGNERDAGTVLPPGRVRVLRVVPDHPPNLRTVGLDDEDVVLAEREIFPPIEPKVFIWSVAAQSEPGAIGRPG